MEQPKAKTRMDAIGVIRELRSEIEAGSHRLRDRLPAERILAERFSVSRGTIRRALNELAADGLVSIKPGSGAYVTGRSLKAVDPVLLHARPLELMDVRFALEPHICRLAALNAVEADFDVLDQLLSGMETSGEDKVAFSDLDTEFHAKLAEVTGNSLLKSITEQMNSVRVQPQWVQMLYLTLESGIVAEYNQQHRAIVDAIRRRDPERAAGLMKDHLETARLSLTRASAT